MSTAQIQCPLWNNNNLYRKVQNLTTELQFHLSVINLNMHSAFMYFFLISNDQSHSNVAPVLMLCDNGQNEDQVNKGK